MAKPERKGAAKKAGASSVDNRKPKHSNDVNRPSKGVGFQRDAATVRTGAGRTGWRRTQHGCAFRGLGSMLFCAPLQVRRLNMYKKRPTRDKKGRIVHEVRELRLRSAAGAAISTPPRHARTL